MPQTDNRDTPGPSHLPPAPAFSYPRTRSITLFATPTLLSSTSATEHHPPHVNLPGLYAILPRLQPLPDANTSPCTPLCISPPHARQRVSLCRGLHFRAACHTAFPTANNHSNNRHHLVQLYPPACHPPPLTQVTFVQQHGTGPAAACHMPCCSISHGVKASTVILPWEGGYRGRGVGVQAKFHNI